MSGSFISFWVYILQAKPSVAFLCLNQGELGMLFSLTRQSRTIALDISLVIGFASPKLSEKNWYNLDAAWFPRLTAAKFHTARNWERPLYLS